MAVKAGVERRGDFLAMSLEERKRNVIESVKECLGESPDIYEEYGERIDQTIEVSIR